MELKKEKLFISAVAVTALAYVLFLCTGCGHNQSALISGKAFILGGQGIQYYNGTILLDNSRENSQWKVEVDDDDAIHPGIADEVATDTNVGSKGIKSIERRIDKQITGYLVEVAKYNPEAVREYLKESDKQATSKQDAEGKVDKTVTTIEKQLETEKKE